MINIYSLYIFIPECEIQLNRNIPSTMSLEKATAVPKGFLRWILISPESDCRQSFIWRRLWIRSLTIFMLPLSKNSEPSLNQLIAESCAGNGILKEALRPTFTTTLLEELWRSTGSNLCSFFDIYITKY